MDYGLWRAQKEFILCINNVLRVYHIRLGISQLILVFASVPFSFFRLVLRSSSEQVSLTDRLGIPFLLNLPEQSVNLLLEYQILLRTVVLINNSGGLSRGVKARHRGLLVGAGRVHVVVLQGRAGVAFDVNEYWLRQGGELTLVLQLGHFALRRHHEQVVLGVG